MNKHWIKLAAALLMVVFAGTALVRATPDGAISLKRLHPPYQQNDRIFAYALSPDQQTVVYNYIASQTNTSALYAVSRRGTSAPIRLSTPGQVIYKPFVITPDSQAVIYNTGQGLSKVSLSGGDAHTITLPLSPTHGIGDFWLTPDSQKLVYQISQSPLINERLLVMDADGGAPTEIASSATRIHVDGVTNERVVYEAARDPQAPLVWGMFSASLGGGAPIALTGSLPAAYGTEFGQVSADGQSAVVRVKDTANQSNFPHHELYEARLDGSSLVRLSAADHFWPSMSPVQSPDGQRIVYTNTVSDTYDSHLYSVPRGGGTPVRLDGPEVVNIGPLKITADSQHVVFQGAVLEGNSTRYRLFRAPLAGGPPRPSRRPTTTATPTSFWPRTIRPLSMRPTGSTPRPMSTRCRSAAASRLGWAAGWATAPGCSRSSRSATATRWWRSRTARSSTRPTPLIWSTAPPGI